MCPGTGSVERERFVLHDTLFALGENLMFRNKFQTAALIGAALASVTIGSAQAPKGGGKGAAPPPPPQKIMQIKPDLYVVTGAGGNSTVRVTKDGIILVDTKNLGENFYNELIAQIKTVSDKPVKEVIVTHVHQDHSGNTGRFIAAGARVTANEGEKAEVATYTSAAGKPDAPSVTYADKTVIKLGGAKAEVYHFGNGHTGGDSMVYFPDLKVLCGGDAIVGAQPNFDYPNGGSLLGEQKELSKAAKLKFDTVVPGHSGQASVTLTRADFDAYKMKIDTLVTRFKEQIKAGTPKDQILAKVKTDDLGWNVNTAQWQAPARLDPLYDEFSKAK
jgi:glyoxylase-like metal-dependent hydrolase (beta-lactamase superfamily II)